MRSFSERLGIVSAVFHFAEVEIRVRPCVMAFAVFDSDPTVSVVKAGDLEHRFRDLVADVLACGENGVAAVRGVADPCGGRAFDVHFLAFRPQFVNFGTCRSVEVALFERVHDGAVFELIGFDHDKAAAAVPARMTLGEAVVVIVRRDAEYLIAAAEHFVVGVLVEFGESADDAAVVVNFHGENALYRAVVVKVLLRPRGVVVAREESLFARLLYHIADVPVISLKVGSADVFLRGAQIGVIFAYVFRIETRDRRVVRVFGIKADVRAGGVVPSSVVRHVVDVHFVARYRHEVFVVEVGVVDQDVVVGKRYYRIAVALIDLFELLDGVRSVGQHAVAVHIRLVKISVFGEQPVFHFFFS